MAKTVPLLVSGQAQLNMPLMRFPKKRTYDELLLTLVIGLKRVREVSKQVDVQTVLARYSEGLPIFKHFACCGPNHGFESGIQTTRYSVFAYSSSVAMFAASPSPCSGLKMLFLA